MALQGLVDWRGRLVDKKKHGGVKASMFIHFLIVMVSIATIPMLFNLVSYLTGTMHMGVKDASTTSTNFFGAFCFFSFLGAFISDSYISRFYTILIFAPIEIMAILIVMVNMANVPMIFNLASYLLGTMHMDVKEASTTSTNFFGAFCFFSILGAFISDSYISHFYTILIFAPLEIMGYVLLACQAHFPSLHPPPCDMINKPSECTPVSGRNKSLLMLGLYLVPIGESSMRACAAALGGDQFDDDNPAELYGKVSFFNWFAFCISLGGFVGLAFLVWLQDNKGWTLGFTIALVMVLVGVVGVGVGLPFYRHRKPTGSPVTRILQVFVAAFRKRRLPLPENVIELHDVMDDGTGMESIERTAGFRFLEKAAVDDGGERGPWSLCTVTQVEEAKIIIRMIPIFLSSILAYIPFPLSLLLALTVQQGAIMDTRLGGVSIPPGSLFVVVIAFQMVFLVVYDRTIVPWLRRATGYAGGVRHLQRVGVGFVSSAVALATAAVVEGYRRRRALAGDPPSSAFLLTPQFFAIGVMDVTSFVGLLEFFSSEASPAMKSIGSSILFCVLGIGSWLGSLLIRVVNRATKHRSGGHGWLDGASLNASRLDLFYWLLALLGLIAFFLYMLCAWTYTYRHDPRMQTTMDDEKVSTPASTKQSPVDANKVSTPPSMKQSPVDAKVSTPASMKQSPVDADIRHVS